MDLERTFLKIHTGSDLSSRRLPLMRARASAPGPIVWLTACSHGDEVGGVVVIQEIFKRLKQTPLLKGEVHAFPLMNPMGFEHISRHVTISEEDLNRSFPGDPKGSLAQRIAHRIFHTIMDTNPTLVLDLHNDWIKSIPYVVIDANSSGVSAKVMEACNQHAKHTGFLMVKDTDQIPASLTHSLLMQGIPALTFELGESIFANETHIAAGVNSVWNLLSKMHMVPAVSQPFRHLSQPKGKSELLHYSAKPLASSSGLIRYLAKPGDVVKAGKPLAKIYNVYGRVQETVRIQHDGIILGLADTSVAFPGSPLAAFGLFAQPQNHL